MHYNSYVAISSAGSQQRLFLQVVTNAASIQEGMKVAYAVRGMPGDIYSGLSLEDFVSVLNTYS